MNSSERETIVADVLAEWVRVALQASVQHVEPAARVRAAVLQAAAAGPPGLSRAPETYLERRPVTKLQPARSHSVLQSAFESRLLGDMWQTQMYGRRFVV
ncbi:MAG TPA: hypothetical protein VJG32_15135 [Anaerolineae bacterium]|nr:hypothetical protein [Anaerolineae bacterium]